MPDFEEIGETFEEGFKKVKDFTKDNKVLVIAILAIGAFALYKLYTDDNSTDTEYTSGYAYVPTTYDGYPTQSESVNYNEVVEQLRTETTDLISEMMSYNEDFYNEMADSNNELYEDMIRSNEEFYDETMSDVSKLIEDFQYDNEKQLSNIIDSIDNQSNKVNESLSYLEEQRKKQEEIIAEMKANSEAWHTASEAEKKALEEQNQILGSLIGANFDSASGTWSLYGDSIYDVSNKNTSNYSTGDKTSVSSSSYDANTWNVINLMTQNSQAWHTASDSKKKRLEEENQKLGKSIGATYDSASGTWSLGGQNLYNINSGSSGSSGSKSSSNSKSSSGSTSTSSVISQMQANSKAWHTASDSEKKRLEKENQSLGKSIGATYNSASGTWTNSSGKKLY